MKHRCLFLLMMLTLAACRGQLFPSPEPSPLPARASAKTDNTVQGEFLRFFNAYGGVESFGQPLTAVFMVDGWRVQYFEKGRLEFHPENEPDYHVTVGWLGEQLRRRSPPISAGHVPAANDPYRRYYSQTGHTLSGDFLTYFDSRGGSVRFGLPISEPFLWEGRVTQDFQSARFFWTPAADPPVTLEDIGRVHLATINR